MSVFWAPLALKCKPAAPPLQCYLNELWVTAAGAVIEIYNGSDSPISLTDYELIPEAQRSRAQDLAGVTLDPGEFVTVPLDLSDISGNVIRFFLVEKETWNLVDVLQVGPLAIPITYARFPDGTGRTWTVSDTTLGSPNA